MVISKNITILLGEKLEAAGINTCHAKHDGDVVIEKAAVKYAANETITLVASQLTCVAMPLTANCLSKIYLDNHKTLCEIYP